LTLSVPDKFCSTFDWVYLMNVVLLLTLSVPDKCCSTLDFECTWWMLFYFWLWMYLMNVVLLLTDCTWWMLFYFWLWAYLINVVLLFTLSVPDEWCSTFDIAFIWWMLFYFWLWMYLMNVVLLLSQSKVEQNLSGTLKVKSRTTFISYTQSQK
jgi:hypothetical protein